MFEGELGVHAGAQHGGMERLGDGTDSADLEGVGFEHWLAMAGIEHDRDVLDTRIAFAFFAPEVVADAGYFPIEIDEIGLGSDCKLAPPRVGCHKYLEVCLEMACRIWPFEGCS
jgi:hypothetical protein